MEQTDDPFSSSILSMRILLSIIEIGANIKENLKKKIEHQVEGKCISEGLVMPNSIQVVSYSGGKPKNGDVEYQVVYQCNVCLPIEGMKIECRTKSITKAGIHAEYTFDNQPIIAVFITRDDNVQNAKFEKIKNTDETIIVEITGVIFELNDPVIATTADLV